jgi:hypothetical protein
VASTAFSCKKFLRLISFFATRATPNPSAGNRSGNPAIRVSTVGLEFQLPWLLGLKNKEICSTYRGHFLNTLRCTVLKMRAIVYIFITSSTGTGT